MKVSFLFGSVMKALGIYICEYMHSHTAQQSWAGFWEHPIAHQWISPGHHHPTFTQLSSLSTNKTLVGKGVLKIMNSFFLD